MAVTVCDLPGCDAAGLVYGYQPAASIFGIVFLP
jgi:hypothetical protein